MVRTRRKKPTTPVRSPFVKGDTDEESEEEKTSDDDREDEEEEEQSDSSSNQRDEVGRGLDSYTRDSWSTPSTERDTKPTTDAKKMEAEAGHKQQGRGLLQTVGRIGVGTAQSQREELAWQITKGRETKEEISGSLQLMVFLVMHKAGKVGMIHTISRYSGRGSEINGKYVAFIGDFNKFGGTPHPVLLPSQKAWEVYHATIATSAKAYLDECEENLELRSKTWDGGELTSEISTPHMLHIPLILVQMLVEKGGNLTPYDVLQIIYSKYYDDTVEMWETGWEKVAEWCMMAAQRTKLAIEVEAITEQDEQFNRWTQQRLNCTLSGSKEGESKEDRESITSKNGQGQRSMDEIEAMARGVILAIFQQGVMPQSQATQNGGNGTGDSKEYDDEEKALLLGFHGVYFAADIQPFWITAKTAKVGTVRRVIMNSMQDFAYKN